ncbi:hypothetical protein [Celeribacter sp.]|uniref:hypothetical protein n=1 Tax=Celeribacter sp. TaxID=1890673 RepID=UPI003A929D28
MAESMAHISPVTLPSVISVDRLRAWWVAAASFGYAFFEVLSRDPHIGTFANYAGILSGFVFAISYVIAHPQMVRVRRTELMVLAFLLLALPMALGQAQNPLDIAGNLMRALFLLLAVVFWRTHSIDLAQVIHHLYRALWVVVVAVVAFIILARASGMTMPAAHHVPAIIFLFSIALFKGRRLPVFALLVMAIITGKEATYLALLSVTGAYLLLRQRLIIGLLVLALVGVFAVAPVNPIIYGLNALGGNFARLADFLTSLTTGHFDDELLTQITSNRYLEYLSVFQDWRDQGVPYFGRGLGATVLVEVGWANEWIERSTLHNSFLVIFHTTGVFGAAFAMHYVISPLWRIRKQAPEITLVCVGCVVYALFSNTMLQAPTLVFSLALAKRISERMDLATPKRRLKW